MSRDLTWQKVTRKWRHLTRSRPEEAVEGQELTFLVRLSTYRVVIRRRSSPWQEMTSCDLTWLSDQEVTSFVRNSPGSGCGRPRTGAFGMFELLQGCNLQKVAVTWQKMTTRDLRWPEVTRKLRHLTGSQQKVAVQGRELAFLYVFSSYRAVARRWQSHVRKWRHVTRSDPEVTHLTGSQLEVAVVGREPAFCVHLSSYRAVTCRRWYSHDREWCYVTSHAQKWRHLTASHLEVAVEGRELAFCVHLSFYEALTRRRWLHVTGNDVTWPHVAGSNPEVTSFDRKSPRSGCRRHISRVLGTFELLQRCNSQEVAVTWQELASRDRKLPGSDVIWPEVTWKWL